MWQTPRKPGVQDPGSPDRSAARPGQADDHDRRLKRLEQPQITTLQDFAVANLPSAADNRYGVIMVPDEATGCQPAFSDGTNWRRFSDRAIVS